MEGNGKNIFFSLLASLLLVITLASIMDDSGLFFAKKVSCTVTDVDYFVVDALANYTLEYDGKKVSKDLSTKKLSVGDKYTLYKVVYGNGVDWVLLTKSELKSEVNTAIIRCGLLAFASVISLVYLGISNR